MSERRYSDDEVRRIFDRAARTDSGAVGSGGSAATGLTLTELQEIGSEAGLSPDAVARAAASLSPSDPSGASGVQRIPVLGIPLGLNQRVPLGRTVDEAEWGWLVMHLRETFSARGHTESSGGFREWWNGNLRVALEPAEGGDVLHMSTRKSGVREANILGVVFLGMAAFLTVVMGLKGQLVEPDKVAVGVMMALGGLGAIAGNTLRLPGWFNRRKAQFESVARTMLSRGDAKQSEGDQPPRLSQGEEPSEARGS